MESVRGVLIEGDGIGPELVASALVVVEATGVRVEWDERLAGQAALERFGHVAPRETIEAITDSGCALKGPTYTPLSAGGHSANYYLRYGLDLFGGIRRFVAPESGVDFLLVRENLEDLYRAKEVELGPDVVRAIRTVTRRGSRRVAKLAFELAEKQRRLHLTIIHKANNLKLSDGLFLRTAREVAAEHKGIVCDDMLADTAAGAVVMSPDRLEVLLTSYTFGDLLSSVAAAVCGGHAMVSTLNVGSGGAVLAEAGHGSAPEIAGTGRANPLGFLGALAMLLDARGFEREAAAVNEACAAVRITGAVTPDLGGTATTREVAEAVADEVRARLSCRKNERTRGA